MDPEQTVSIVELRYTHRLNIKYICLCYVYKKYLFSATLYLSDHISGKENKTSDDDAKGMASLIGKMAQASRTSSPFKLHINGKSRMFQKEIRLVLETGRTEYWTSDLDYTPGLIYWYDTLGGFNTSQFAPLLIFRQVMK